MVHVGNVWVLILKAVVPVRMRLRPLISAMFVMMLLVADMPVLVSHRLVDLRVGVVRADQ